MSQFFIVLCLFLFPLNSVNGFDAGFLQLVPVLPKGSDTTHYSMTVCALCRVTIDYLRTAYHLDTTYLESKANVVNGQCQGNLVNEIVDFLNKSSSQSKANPWSFEATTKTIASSNTKTDLKEMLEEDSHFDSEAFIDGSQLILTRYEAAKESIVNQGNFDQSRRTFGEMLHTIQDFYSHTNYIELGNEKPSDALANRVFQSTEIAPISMRTCISCKNDDCQNPSNIVPDVLNGKFLTSGYFIPVGYSWFVKGKPAGKCSHGGSADGTSDREPTGGINKDTLKGKHGLLHYDAATVAYQSTVQILTKFRQDIGDDNFGQFLSLKQRLNSLVITIDIACSMIGYIELAKTEAITIVNEYRTITYGPYNYILVTFNSTNADLIVNSEDPQDLSRAIENIKSCQITNSSVGELYYHGLIEGLKPSEYNSVVYTFTDSPASDAYLKYQARALLRSKKAVIYSFLSQKMLTDLDPLDGSNGDTDLATISGGLTFPIYTHDSSAIAEFIARRLEWTRLQTLVMLSTTSKTTDFYVDSSIDELQIEICSLGEIVNLDGIQLFMPNNSIYPIKANYTNTKHLYMWRIGQPPIGKWRLTTANLTAQLNFTVEIQGKTNLIYSSTPQRKMLIDRDTSGYTLLTNEPLIHSDLLILTTYANLSVSSIVISLIDIQGNVISTYSSTQTASFGILTEINVPEQQFRIGTLLTLTDGRIIQRMEKQIISPTIYSIELTNPPFIVRPGEILRMNYTIKCAKPDDQVAVQLEIIDTLKLISNGTIQKNITFRNQTFDMETVLLSQTNQPKFTTSLVIFSISSFTNKISYENDDMASLFIDVNSLSSTIQINYFLFIFVFIYFQLN